MSFENQLVQCETMHIMRIHVIQCHISQANETSFHTRKLPYVMVSHLYGFSDFTAFVPACSSQHHSSLSIFYQHPV